ncbi:O-antigen ligase [mine drainage metagenome]|uniref:O-antigen ligase n=1 Tax=mine drainage metagenome TaxID=410659 RepID=A0A1J5Q1B3_9ZZZZ
MSGRVLSGAAHLLRCATERRNLESGPDRHGKLLTLSQYEWNQGRQVNSPDRQPVETFGLWLIGLMWVLPFLNPRHQLPIPSFYGELFAFVLGMLALMTLFRKEVWANFQLPGITLLPFGLIILILLQTALGMVVFPQMALIGMQYLLWACLLMVLGQRLRVTLGWERLAITLAWFLVASGVINVAMAMLQYAGIRSVWLFPKLSAQNFGNLGQPNHFADYMALAIGSLGYLFAKRRLSGFLAALTATAFLTMLALSGSRSSWLYLVAFLLLAWARPEPLADGENRQLMLACLLLLPSFALLQAALHWLLPLLGSLPHLLADERFFQQVSGTSVRLRLWQNALQMFATHPWLGIGYGQFQWHSFLLAGSHGAGEFSRPAEHAHNLPLQLLAELGMPAGLLLIGCLWRWIRAAAVQAVTLEIWWLRALLTVLGIHSLLEYPLWYSFFLGIAAILLGAGDTRMLRADFSRLGRPALAAVLVLGLYSAASVTQSYSTLASWVDRARSHQIQDNELPRFRRDMSQLMRGSMLTPYVELIYALALTPSRELLNEKLLLSANALRFKPVSDLAYRHAELLALKGDQKAALLQLKLAENAYPEDFRKHFRRLQELGLINAGRTDGSPKHP